VSGQYNTYTILGAEYLVTEAKNNKIVRALDKRIYGIVYLHLGSSKYGQTAN